MEHLTLDDIALVEGKVSEDVASFKSQLKSKVVCRVYVGDEIVSSFLFCLINPVKAPVIHQPVSNHFIQTTFPNFVWNHYGPNKIGGHATMSIPLLFQDSFCYFFLVFSRR